MGGIARIQVTSISIYIGGLALDIMTHGNPYFSILWTILPRMAMALSPPKWLYFYFILSCSYMITSSDNTALGTVPIGGFMYLRWVCKEGCLSFEICNSLLISYYICHI